MGTRFSYRGHVDWLTTTWPHGEALPQYILAQTIGELVLRNTTESTAHWPTEPWAWHGYVGWQQAGIRWGIRPDSTIVQATGAWAHEYCTQLDIIGRNVSRLDLCVDIWAEIDPDALIAEHKDASLAHRETLDSRPYKVALVNGFGGGDTLYLGSRQSETFVRIYNKEKEQDGKPEYKGVTRYEVEYKGDAAGAALERCRARRYDSASCALEVLGVLRRRGVELHLGELVPRDARPDADKPRPAIDATLAWFRQQVAPSVARALRVVDRADILQALGLDEGS